MFIPYGTDAPIYHWPKATVGLIVANVLVFAATVGMDPDARLGYAMSMGHGLHPVEWVTSVFMHAGVGHLVGNMIFLWAFGIVVEGKLGVPRFLAVYLGIGVTQAALMQLVSLGAEGGHILGASAAIYGLLAVCLVWAPQNELNCLWFWRFIPQQIDVAIVWFALLYIGMELFVVLRTGGEMRTEFLHLTGAVIGLVVGSVMVKAGLVDCENWDIFAVMQGRKGLTREAAAKRSTSFIAPRPVKARGRKTAKAKADAPQVSAEDPSEAATRRVRRHLEANDPAAAHAAYDKALRTVAGWQPPGPDWLALIKALLDAKEWRPAVSVMEDYLRRAPDPSPRVRLKLAQVLVREQGRPTHALRVLAEIPPGSLPDALEKNRKQIAAEAERQVEEGVLELEGDAW
jgi:membrane associated rhomboid family serine protease